jgi:hypothetical protein
VRGEVLYSLLTEFGIPMKLVRVIKMCLNKIYGKVHIGKNLMFLFKMVWNKEMLYWHCFPTLFYNMSSGKSKKIRKHWNCMEQISSWSMLMIICRVKA